MGRRSVVSDEKKKEIYNRFIGGETQQDLANSEGVTQATISRWISQVESSQKKPAPKKKQTQSSSTPKSKKRESQEKESVVKALREEIKLLTERIEKLEQRRLPQRKPFSKVSPRRDQVVEILSDGGVYNYQHLADRANCSVSAIRNVVSHLPEGEYRKMTSMEKRGDRRIGVVYIQKVE